MKIPSNSIIFAKFREHLYDLPGDAGYKYNEMVLYYTDGAYYSLEIDGLVYLPDFEIGEYTSLYVYPIDELGSEVIKCAQKILQGEIEHNRKFIESLERMKDK